MDKDVGADRALVSDHASYAVDGPVGFDHGEKFTPGPWVLLHTDDGHLIRMGTFLQSGRKAPHHEVAYCHGLFIDDDYPTAQDEFAEAEANANLIAAAPDLFAALDKCRAIIKFHCKPEKCCSFKDGDGPFSALDAFGLAVDALAKARGEA